MRIETIAKDTVYFLSPCMPLLSELEEGLLTASHQTKSLVVASRLWGKLKLKFNGEGHPKDLVQDFINEPDNEIIQAIFRHQLSRLLKEDKRLYKELEQLLRAIA